MEKKSGTGFRRFKWIFSKSGIIMLSFEHFLAMVPATILVPILVNNTIGVNVVDMALVLFTSGLGTILFSICSSFAFSQGKARVVPGIPAYLGSSFAYIGLTIYLIQIQMGEGIEPGMAYVYVGYSYLFSGFLLLILSFLYKLKFIVRFFSEFLPASVIGPAISLIGLELADTAIVDSGIDTATGRVDAKSVIVAIVTLVMIILLSLIKRRVFKNTAIILGMVAGYVVYLMLNGFPEISLSGINWFQLPRFRVPFLSHGSLLPPGWERLLISVVPATLVVFMENIGRVTVIHRMQNEGDEDARLFDEEAVKMMERALRSHGIASMASAVCGSVPNTIYAENIAVMGIHKNAEPVDEPDPFIRRLTDPLSIIPYWGAAAIAILASMMGVLQAFLLGIPKPVIGGMELFLFGIISAPGIQLLVDQRVNYKKISNQIITAAVLITGISELSITFDRFELKGMSLGLVVGFLLNALVLLLKRFGLLCDPLSMDEVVDATLGALPKNRADIGLGIESASLSAGFISIEDMQHVLAGREGFCTVDGEKKQASVLREAVDKASVITVGNGDAVIRIKHTANRITLGIRRDALPEETAKIYMIDYRDAIDTEEVADMDGDGKSEHFLTVDLFRNISLHKAQRLIRDVLWKEARDQE